MDFSWQKDIHYQIIHSHYWMSGLGAASLSDLWGGTPILHMFHTLGLMKNRIPVSEIRQVLDDSKLIQRAGWYMPVRRFLGI